MLYSTWYVWGYLAWPFGGMILLALAYTIFTGTRTYRRMQRRMERAQAIRLARRTRVVPEGTGKHRRVKDKPKPERKPVERAKVRFEDGPAEDTPSEPRARLRMYLNRDTAEVIETADELDAEGWVLLP